METLDKLIISSIDNEKALADFKQELAGILNCNVEKIYVEVVTSTNHSVISQKLLVTVKFRRMFSKKELNQIPFSTLSIDGDNSLFFFDIGEGCI